MGIIRNLKEKTKKEAKNQIKEKIKQGVRKILSTVLVKIFLIILATSFIVSFFSWLIEKFTAKDTPTEIYETLEVEQVNELVEVKGNENDGYHLEFAEDMDEKLDTLIDTLNRREGLYSLKKSDKELLKKMIKAEIVTQFPDLGGQVDENDSNQFQGAITVRRVTPDKEIGELKSTGAGEKTTADDLKAENNEEDKKITYEKGQELQIKQTVYVYLKGDYNFLGDKKSDDGVTEKRKTVLNKIEGVDSSIEVTKGDRVYYTGNTFYFENNTYIEIAKEKDAEIVIGYVKNVNTELPKTNDITKDKTQEANDSEEKNQATKTIGDGNEEFVIAIAAGHNSSDDKGYSEGDFVEENLTIQVATKVEELFREYSNIKVVQTGSTSEQDVKREERTQLASDVNPDICIQIYFNSGNGDSGVEACYEYGDGKSQRLAELLSEKISKKMGLENKGTITGEGVSNYYDIIDSSADTGFPSVITKGCFLDNKKDQEALKNGGVSQYAKGIVEACEEYLVTNKGDDTVTYVEQNDTYSRIRSRVYDLQYVPQETFKKYVDESDKRALEVYTLDDSYNLVTATWKVEGTTQEDAGFTINQNSPMNFRTTLEKVTMPYEYLLFFLIDSDQKKFVEDLADVVIQDTEIIIAVQDNITTTDVNTTVQQCKKITSDTGNQAGQFEEGWHEVPDNEDKFTESCSTSVSVTYADTWFMKYSKGTTYSSKSLNVDRGEKVDLIKNVKGNMTDTITRTNEGWNDNNDGGVVINSGSGSYSVQNNRTTSNYNYTYEIRERKETITHTISNSYNANEEPVVSGDISKFIKLFKKYKMGNAVAEEWLFDIIEDNERTANLSDLTRYMVFKATELDYGVTDFDFEEFAMGAFQEIGGIYGGTIQEKVWFAILDAGFSEYAAAGVMGNIEAESGFNAGVIEGGSGIGAGLCQWSFGRRTQLESYAASKGVDWTDENTQIEFLIGEITPGGGANGYAGYALMSYHGYSPTDWENADSPTNAAIAFCWTFERPGIPRMDVRTEAAERYYNEFHGKQRTAGGSLLQAADTVAQYVDSNLYSYVGTDKVGYTFPIASSSTRTISCSSYIQEVLLQAGYMQCAGGERLWARTNSALSKSDFDSLGIPVEIITDLNQIQPGDILQYTTGYHVVLAYSVSGDNIQIKGVPEVLNPSAPGIYQGYGANGVTRTRAFLQGKGCYIVRINK